MVLLLVNMGGLTALFVEQETSGTPGDRYLLHID